MPINKRSAEYWQKRFEQLEDAQNNKGLQYFKDLERIYGKAISETEKDIAKWYQRYAREEGISLAEAKKQLSKGELKEFRMTVQEYIEKGQSLLDPAWKKELERASTKFHVTRLEALKLQMQQNVEYLMGNEADGIDKLMRDIFTDSYYHSAYEIHKGLGIGWDLMKLDNKVIDKAMSNPWTADGTNFSKRIWGKYRPELVKKLHDGLTLNLIQGKRADKLIDDITKQFNVKRHQAENLVQTEKAYFQSLAQKDSFKAMNVKEYEIVATLDTKTSDICREMDGKVFKLDDFAPGATAPPFHNRCRTATAPFFDDEFEEDVRRAARDEDGKYYTVPANMKYNDWYKAFVDGDESVLEKFTKIVDNVVKEETVKQIVYDIVGNTTKLKDAMSAEDYEAYTSMLNNHTDESIKKIYVKYADGIDSIKLTKSGGVYVPSSNTIEFNYNHGLKYEEINKYSTLAHEYGHYFDAKIKANVDFKELDALNDAVGSEKFKKVVSSSDEFLEAVRKDRKHIKSIYSEDIKDDLKAHDASHGVQDAIDGLFSNSRISWGYGEKYYNRKYSSLKFSSGGRTIFDLRKNVQQAYKNLGLDASNQGKTKMLVRQYEASSEIWANIMSAHIVGGKELEYVKKYLPNSYEAMLKILEGVE